MPRKILQENPRQNPPNFTQQKSPTHFCRGAGPTSQVQEKISLRDLQEFRAIEVTGSGKEQIVFELKSEDAMGGWKTKREEEKAREGLPKRGFAEALLAVARSPPPIHFAPPPMTWPNQNAMISKAMLISLRAQRSISKIAQNPAPPPPTKMSAFKRQGLSLSTSLCVSLYVSLSPATSAGAGLLPSLVCPISRSVMREPVVASDGDRCRCASLIVGLGLVALKRCDL